MAHFASKRFNYWGQLGMLTAFCGAGLILGGFFSLIPIANKLDLKSFTGGSNTKIMANLMVPENATPLRWMQFISTLFLFFLPPVFYALICHRKPLLHLGFKHTVTIPQIMVVILLIVACLPVVDSLQELTLKFPWSKATLARFAAAELDYDKEISIMARMNNFTDYLVAMVIIAFLPALFEETFFRGGIQNLLTRWFKMPVVAIVITSVIFSAVHGSYLGFLSRFALSVVLGFMYYRTGNLWLNAIGHFFNNAFGVTVLYFSTKPGVKIDAVKVNDHLPLWTGLLGIAAIYGLFILFEIVSKKDIDRPGQEVIIPGDINTTNPFLSDDQNFGHSA